MAITQKELQDQLADLKAEIVAISGVIADRTGGAADRARPLIYDASQSLWNRAESALEQGRAVIGAVRENPRAAPSAALTAGLLSLAIVWLIRSENSRR
jgi:hypothetical protein